MTPSFGTPYGAFELKSCYQRNMLMGTGFSVSLTIFIVVSVWLYSLITYEEIIDERSIIIKVITDIGPPPSLEHRPPQVDITKPKANPIKVGIPVPVDASEIAEEEPLIASRKELAEINTPVFGGDTAVSGAIIVFDIPPDEIIPPDTFVSVEIPPEMVYEELPKYPRIAQEGGFTGWVRLKAYVDKHGDVKKVEVVRTNRPNIGFEDAAIEAAYKCKYRPAVQNGEPIGVWVSYTIKFTL